LPQRFSAEGAAGTAALFAESHLWATLTRVFLGFLIGAAPGILLGVLMGMSRTVRTMIDATLSAFYVLPKIAIFPIMMLVFPDPFGEGPKVAVVAISAFFLVAINTMVGVRDIDPVYLEAGRNYGAGRWQMLRHVIVPGAMPVIFAGLRLALGTALIVIIAIEFVRAKTGVGFLTFYYWEILAPEKMYAGLVVVMLLGVLLTAGLQWVERLIMPWRRDPDSHAG
jgi:ABC-type nitrate/sulfonate/bicarbonate transport system permease component